MANLTVSPTIINVTNNSQNTVIVDYTSNKTLTDVKLSTDNGLTYKDKLNMTQTRATFSINNMQNGTYDCKLKGYYEDDFISKNNLRSVAFVLYPWKIETCLDGIDMYDPYEFSHATVSLPIDNKFDTNNPICDVTETQLDIVVEKLQSKGIVPIIKLHNVSLYEDGQGNQDKPTNASIWFTNFKKIVDKWSDYVVNKGLDTIILSNEMHNVMNIASNKQYFTPIINNVKNKGLKVSCSVNTPEIIENDGFQYWDELDFYCVNTYPQLTDKGKVWALNNLDETRNNFYKKWSDLDVDYGELFANLGGESNLHKDIYITELGCIPSTTGLLYPAYWGSGQEYDEEVQKIFMYCVIDILENDIGNRLSNRVKKYMLWDGNSDSDFNMVGKQSEDVLRKYWNDEDINLFPTIPPIPTQTLSIESGDYHVLVGSKTLEIKGISENLEGVNYYQLEDDIGGWLGVATYSNNKFIVDVSTMSTWEGMYSNFRIKAYTASNNLIKSSEETVNVIFANNLPMPEEEKITVQAGTYYCKPSDKTVEIIGTSTVKDAIWYEALADGGSWAGMATYENGKFIVDVSWINWEDIFRNLRIIFKDENDNIVLRSEEVFDIVVTNNPSTDTVSVESVSLDKTSYTFTNDTKIQLISTILPSNATNKTVEWISTNTNVATVSQGGLVTPKENGTCQIKCTTVDGGFIAICNVTVNIEVVPNAPINYINFNDGALGNTFRSSYVVDAPNNAITVTSPNEGGVDGYAIWQMPKIRADRTYRFTCTVDDARSFARVIVDGTNLITKDNALSYDFTFTGQDALTKVIDINLGVRYRNGATGDIVLNFKDVKIIDVNGDPADIVEDVTYDVVDYRIVVSDGVNTESYYSCDDIPKNHPTLGGGVDGYKIVIKNGIKHYLSLTKGESDSKITIDGMKPFNYSIIDQAFKQTWSNRGHAVYTNSLKYTVANRIDNNDYGITDDRPISQDALDRALYIYNCAIPNYMEITEDSNSINSVSEASFEDNFLGICRLYSGQKFHIHQNVRFLGGFGNKTRLYVAILVHEFGHTTGIWDNSPHYPTTYTYLKDQENEWLQPSDIAHIKDKFPHLTGATRTHQEVEKTDNDTDVVFSFKHYKDEDEMTKDADKVVIGTFISEDEEEVKYGLTYKTYNFQVEGDITQIKTHKSYDLGLVSGDNYKMYLNEFNYLLNPSETIIKI